MNKMFMDDLKERLENNIEIVNVWNRESVYAWFVLDGETYLHFPMICFEHTDDSNIEVSIDESKFLNDPEYDTDWVLGGAYDTVDFIFSLKEYGNTLEISVFEINETQRGYGMGGNIVSIIESVAEDYYKYIMVSPFDTSASNFWQHMEYESDGKGHLVKKLD